MQSKIGKYLKILRKFLCDIINMKKKIQYDIHWIKKIMYYCRYIDKNFLIYL